MLAPKLPNFSFCSIKKTKKHNFFLKMTFFIFFFKMCKTMPLASFQSRKKDSQLVVLLKNFIGFLLKKELFSND